MSHPQAIITGLRADLLSARKAVDTLTIAALQDLLSAIDNAGAVPISNDIASVGVGSTEAPRRDLSVQDIQEIVRREIAELQFASKELGDIKSSYADELHGKIAVLSNYLNAG